MVSFTIGTTKVLLSVRNLQIAHRKNTKLAVMQENMHMPLWLFLIVYAFMYSM